MCVLININNLTNPELHYTKELTPIEQVLANRGIKDFENFFNLDWDCVQSPYDLDFINEAADKIIDHVKRNSKIAILVDVDMDGYSSAALLINYIRMQQKYGDFADCHPEIVHIIHKKKIHGLDDVEVMRRIRDEVKPNLFVIPDASGTKQQYQALTDLGIDIVVLDHHDTSERGDGEKVIVVNNQQSKNYKNKFLCGVGIVWQLCRVLDDKLSFVCADNYIDLVALGLVSDVMDLRSPETRFLVWQGLKPDNINSYFLQYAQFSLYGLQNSNYNPHQIAFQIAPLFNAVNRFGNDEEREMVFRSLLDDDSREKVKDGTRGHTGEVDLVVEMMRRAGNTRSRQNRRRDKLVDMVDNLIREEGLAQNQIIMLAIDDFEEEYRALTGLVAGIISEYYNRPCILAFHNGDGTYSGSFRCPNNMPIYETFKDDCNASGLVNYASGHQQAAGIGFDADKIEAIVEFFNKKYEGMSTDVSYNVDFVIDASDPRLPDIIRSLAEYKDLWGQGVKEPLIAITNVKLAQSTLTNCGKKNEVLKISLPNDCELINFKSSPEEYHSLCLPYDGKTEQYYVGTVIGYDPDINSFRYQNTPQLKIADYEIVDTKYDF